MRAALKLMWSALGGSSPAPSTNGKSARIEEKEEAMPNREPDDELLAAALAGTRDCPSLEELERLLNEGAPGSLKRHVDACSYCQTELRMLRSFTSNEVAEHE